MPLCIRCKEVFPPNYTEVIENSKPDFSGLYPQECIFCKLNIDKVERETAKGSGKYTMYSKQECLRDYKEFLFKLKKSRNVKDILKKNNKFM